MSGRACRLLFDLNTSTMNKAETPMWLIITKALGHDIMVAMLWPSFFNFNTLWTTKECGYTLFIAKHVFTHQTTNGTDGIWENENFFSIKISNIQIRSIGNS